MIFSLVVLSLSTIYLFFLNTFLKKNNFCLDKASNYEKHKILLELNDKTPLSGSFFSYRLFFSLAIKLILFFPLYVFYFF